MSKEDTFGQTDVVRLSGEDAAVALLERGVTGLWEVVSQLTRFRRTTRQTYRVTSVGSARLTPGATALTTMGRDSISGGGPGLMLAANAGARSVDSQWGRRSLLQESGRLASEVDCTIPHGVDAIEETVALIRENRAAWLATQTAK
jgi:hypothetical protein